MLDVSTLISVSYWLRDAKVRVLIFQSFGLAIQVGRASLAEIGRPQAKQ